MTSRRNDLLSLSLSLLQRERRDSSKSPIPILRGKTVLHTRLETSSANKSGSIRG